MPKSIHIVGSAPRSGTTLITELMMSCFNIDQGADHERNLARMPEKPFRIRCTKKLEMPLVVNLLDVDPELWIIFMLRDPRDSVVSRHKKASDRYWTNLGEWWECMRAARKLKNHPRFIWLRYEDLIADPDGIQNWLMERMPFLESNCPFSKFHQKANPSKNSLDALNGLRPISSSSIGNWRKHKPRLLAQIQIHGPIAQELINLGYEKDDAWLKELEGVSPDNQTSWQPEHPSLRVRLKRAYKRWQYPRIYARNLAKMREMWPNERE